MIKRDVISMHVIYYASLEFSYFIMTSSKYIKYKIVGELRYLTTDAMQFNRYKNRLR